MDDAVRDYIDGIGPEHRELYDRLHRIVLGLHPEAEVVLSYGMPRYRVGEKRLFIAAWKKWVSIYGWDQGRDSFATRHPELKTKKGTIQLRPEVAAGISDREFERLVRDALG